MLEFGNVMTKETGILLTLIGIVFGGGVTWGIFKNKQNGMAKEIKEKVDKDMCMQAHEYVAYRFNKLDVSQEKQLEELKVISEAVAVMASNAKKRNGD